MALDLQVLLCQDVQGVRRWRTNHQGWTFVNSTPWRDTKSMVISGCHVSLVVSGSQMSSVVGDWWLVISGQSWLSVMVVG